MNRPLFSIIIPVHNRAKMLAECVGSISSALGDDVEILVVDDVSNEDISAGLACFSNIRIIRRNKRGGPGAARNHGVAESKGRNLLFLDSDCTVAPTQGAEDWIERHAKALSNGCEGLFTGGVVGLFKGYGGAVDSYMNWFMFTGVNGDVFKNWHVPMTNVSMSRETFDKVGWFCEELQTLEDVDWSYRARAQNIPFGFVEDAAVLHRDREGLWAAFQHQRQFGISQIVLRGRHPTSRYAWLFPRTLVGSLIMALPLAVLMTIYVVGEGFLRKPEILFYAPGIMFGHMGHSLGIVEGVLQAGKNKRNKS